MKYLILLGLIVLISVSLFVSERMAQSLTVRPARAPLSMSPESLEEEPNLESVLAPTRELAEAIEVLPEGGPEAVLPPPAIPVSNCAEQLDILLARVTWLEAELLVASGQNTGTTVGNWYVLLDERERPEVREVRLMAEYLRDYPVRLQVNEGLWIIERMRLDDWEAYGQSIDEVLIEYLGPQRIAREVTPEALAALRDYWDAEGYFN